MRSPCCLCIPPYQRLNAWTNFYETWYVYHGTWAQLNGVLHKSLPPVCVSLCVSLISLLGKCSVKCIPPFIARQRLGKHVPAATNTRKNKIIVGHVCLWVCLCIPLLLLGNISVKTFPRQRRTVGGVVFYAVHVVSKESRPFGLLRTSCSFIYFMCVCLLLVMTACCFFLVVVCCLWVFIWNILLLISGWSYCIWMYRKCVGLWGLFTSLLYLISHRLIVRQLLLNLFIQPLHVSFYILSNFTNFMDHQTVCYEQ
jgi:hypothetical protein